MFMPLPIPPYPEGGTVDPGPPDAPGGDPGDAGGPGAPGPDADADPGQNLIHIP